VRKRGMEEEGGGQFNVGEGGGGWRRGEKMRGGI